MNLALRGTGIETPHSLRGHRASEGVGVTFGVPSGPSSLGSVRTDELIEIGSDQLVDFPT
jgi:hypothetical protein